MQSIPDGRGYLKYRRDGWRRQSLTRHLREAKKATGVEDCTVVTWDDAGMTEDGIRIDPIWKWLLESCLQDFCGAGKSSSVLKNVNQKFQDRFLG